MNAELAFHTWEDRWILRSDLDMRYAVATGYGTALDYVVWAFRFSDAVAVKVTSPRPHEVVVYAADLEPSELEELHRRMRDHTPINVKLEVKGG